MVHDAADGRQFLLLHGDEADTLPFQSNIARRIASHLDYVLHRADRGLAQATGRSQSQRRSAIEWVLTSVVRANGLRRGHERDLARMARARALDGVI